MGVPCSGWDRSRAGPSPLPLTRWERVKASGPGFSRPAIQIPRRLRRGGLADFLEDPLGLGLRRRAAVVEHFLEHAARAVEVADVEVGLGQLDARGAGFV